MVKVEGRNSRQQNINRGGGTGREKPTMGQKSSE